MPLHAVLDAGLILACRRESCPDCDEAVRRVVAGIHGRVTVGDIVDRTGLKGNAFRAVVRLIGDGLLEVVDRAARIDYPTPVRRAGNPAGAARW
jgi:P2-related tail formation protein